MPFRITASLFLLAFALTTGCSTTHGDPKNPKKNPHPVKRYEITATADAPGSWDSLKGYISYEVINKECTPEDKFLGVHELPAAVKLNFEMTKVDAKTWKGYVYSDLIQDEDYYGLGVCHWKVTGVGPEFSVHGETFTSSDALDVYLHKSPQTEYFKKSEFLNRSLSGDGALVSSADNPKVLQQPDDFFPITVSVQEATPWALVTKSPLLRLVTPTLIAIQRKLINHP